MVFAQPTLKTVIVLQQQTTKQTAKMPLEDVLHQKHAKSVLAVKKLIIVNQSITE